MKHISQVIVILFILFSFSIASARFLPLVQDNELVKATKIALEDSSMQIQEDDDPFHLMGIEEMKCEEIDEEDCAKRRMVAEAHLDYIYTQGIKPQKTKP